jgi:hypothetical protein
MLGSQWEQKKSNATTLPPKENKIRSSEWMLLHSLVAKNLYAYLCSLPLLTKGNG